MGGKATRNMWGRNTNKCGIQRVCWFYSQGIYHNAQSYEPLKEKKTKLFENVRKKMMWTIIFNLVLCY